MSVPDNYQFFCPVKISAGIKALEHLPVDLGGPAASMPLVVTDARWKGRRVADGFRDSGMSIGICDDLPPIPDIDTVRQLADIYREKRCNALIAVGSGPLIDAAKLVNVLVSLGGSDLEMFSGENAIKTPLNPLAIALTASGDGFEVSRFASLGDLAFSSPFLMPQVAVIDPRLLRVKKTEAIIQLALAALSHAVEAYWGPNKNPVADAYAYAAIRLISQNLVAVADGSADKTGPSSLVNGAALAGCALSNASPGMLHLLAEAAAGQWNLLSGQVLGTLLPYAMEYNALKGSHHIAELLLPLAGSEVYSSTAEGLRQAIAVNIVHALLYDLNKATRGAVPLTLKDAGVAQPSLADIAERAAGAGPGLCDEKGALLVLEHAWSGYPIVSL